MFSCCAYLASPPPYPVVWNTLPCFAFPDYLVKVLAVKQKLHQPRSWLPPAPPILWCFLHFQVWNRVHCVVFYFVSGGELQIKTNKFILKHEPLEEAETLAGPSECWRTSVSEGMGLRESFEKKSRLKEQCGNPVQVRVKKEETNVSHRTEKELEESGRSTSRNLKHATYLRVPRRKRSLKHGCGRHFRGSSCHYDYKEYGKGLRRIVGGFSLHQRIHAGLKANAKDAQIGRAHV